MIKRFLAYGALALGLITGGLLLPAEAQYGGYTTVAPQYTTVNLPTCSSAVNAGALAWDTTTTSFKICNGSAWVESGTFGGASISGTTGTIARFDSAGTNVEDSNITDNDITVTLNGGGQIQFIADGTAVNGRWILADVPDAGSGEILNDYTATLSIMDGAGDTITAFNIGLTNVDHTGGNVNALLIAGITGDANATEIGVNIGAGWDQAIRLDDGSATDDTLTFGASADAEIYWDNANGRFALDATDAATGGSVRVTWSDTDGNGLQLSQAATLVHTFAGLLSTTFSNPANMVNFGNGGTIGNMDASDTWNVVRIDVVNGNHASTGNTLNLLFIDAITGDAQSNLHAINIGALTGTTGAASEVESAITVGAGWDYGLSILGDGGAASNVLTLGLSRIADAQIYFDGAALTFDVDGTSTNDVLFNVGQSATGFFTVRDAGGVGSFIFQSRNIDGSNMNFIEIEIPAMIATTGSEVINLLELDWNETEWASSTATLNFISVQAFTPDASADYNGINIGAITGAAGTETGILIGAGWDFGITLPDGSLTDDNIALGANQDAVIFFDGGDLEFDLTTGTADDFHVILDLDGNAEFIVSASSNDLRYIPINVTNFGTDILRLRLGAASNMNGGDIINFFLVDWNDAAYASGVNNELRGIFLAAIGQDSQSGETAIKIDTGWDVGVESTEHIFARQNFNEPLRVLPASLADSTIDLADTDINYVVTANGIQFEYREEQTKTVSSMIFADGGIDISADNGASDNEGVEIYLGASQNTTTGYLIAQTDQLCFTVNATVGLIAGTDQFVIGWRDNAAYVADNLYVGYGDYAVIGINNVDGSIFALSEIVAPDTGTDDSETNWGNGETKTLRVCIDGAGLTHHYLDGTIVAEDDATNPNDFAMTSGINMSPFISYLGISGTDAAIVINWWEITAN